MRIPLGMRLCHASFYESHISQVRASDKFGSTEGLPRFVVIVEISDDVVSALGNSSPQLQIKAYEVALDATQLQRNNTPNVAFWGWSNSVVVDANLADYGEANFLGQTTVAGHG
jgi:hypothetical protein